MKIILYCQSVQKIVQNVVGQGGQTSRQQSFAVTMQTHNGDGRPVDPAVQSGSFGFTTVADTAPDFDAGDVIEVVIQKAQTEQATETAAVSQPTTGQRQ